MEFSRHQLTAHHGIIFCITRVTVTPSNRGKLNTLYFQEAKAAQFEVTRRLVELYNKMLAKDLACVMSVGISNPLTRSQGDWLNEQRLSVIYAVTGISGTIGTQIPAVGAVTGPAAIHLSRKMAQGLPTYHAGDVIVSFDAQVSGGLGPQRSVSSMIIKAQGG